MSQFIFYLRSLNVSGPLILWDKLALKEQCDKPCQKSLMDQHAFQSMGLHSHRADNVLFASKWYVPQSGQHVISLMDSQILQEASAHLEKFKLKVHEKKTQIDLISISKLHSFKSPFKLNGFRPHIQEEKKVGLCLNQSCMI